jgi:hypothetical protein
MEQPSNDGHNASVPATVTTATTSEQPAKASAAAAATNAATTTSSAEDRILKLSEGCRQHRLVHAKRVDVLDEFNAIPEDCQQSLDSLSTILPRLEAEWGTVSSEISALLPAMCDFYRSVLAGAFCPHAPHLFRLGRHGDQGALYHCCFSCVVA